MAVVPLHCRNTERVKASRPRIDEQTVRDRYRETLFLYSYFIYLYAQKEGWKKKTRERVMEGGVREIEQRGETERHR